MDQPGGFKESSKPANSAARNNAPSDAMSWSQLSKIVYPILILIVGLEIVTWVHWNALLETAVWWANPKYSHGYLVPLFAGVLLYLRRDEKSPVVKVLLNWGAALCGIGLLLCVVPMLIPDPVLADSTDYTLTVAGGAAGVADAHGLRLPADFTLKFKTTSEKETLPAVSIAPAAGTANVPLKTAIGIKFGAAMNRDTVNSSTITLRDAVGHAVPGAVSYTAATESALFTPAEPLAGSTTYTLTVAGGARGLQDVKGAPLAADSTSTFTTLAASGGLSVISTAPLAGDATAPATAAINLQFSSPLNADALAPGAITLRDAGGKIVAGSVHYDRSSDTARFEIEPFWPNWCSPLLMAFGVALGIAGVLLFVQERISLAQVSPRDRWIGLAILIGAEGLRIWASFGSHFTPDYYSFVPALLGIFVLVGGLRILRWAGWPIVFLLFMFPLPKGLDSQSGHMQTMAAKASTYVLQTLGMSAERQGNVILVNDNPLEVAKACSGLSMLTIFGALAFAVALLIERPLWERIVIMLSALPIALAANVLRIVVTGIVFVVFPEQHKLGHDAAGLLVMMPAGLLMLFLEIQILSRIFVEDDDAPMPVSPVGAASRAVPQTVPPRAVLQGAAPQGTVPPRSVPLGTVPPKATVPPKSVAPAKGPVPAKGNVPVPKPAAAPTGNAPAPRPAVPPSRSAAPPPQRAVPPQRTNPPPRTNPPQGPTKNP